MASDVEVLCEIRAFVNAVHAAGACAPERAAAWGGAIDRAIATLEAREAQLKVEGRVNEADFADAIAGVAGVLGAELVKREAIRARASEAALRQELDDVRVGLSGAVLLPGFRPDSLGSLVLSERTRLRDALAREAALSPPAVDGPPQPVGRESWRIGEDHHKATP